MNWKRKIKQHLSRAALLREVQTFSCLLIREFVNFKILIYENRCYKYNSNFIVIVHPDVHRFYWIHILFSLIYKLSQTFSIRHISFPSLFITASLCLQNTLSYTIIYFFSISYGISSSLEIANTSVWLDSWIELFTRRNVTSILMNSGSLD